MFNLWLIVSAVFLFNSLVAFGIEKLSKKLFEKS